MTTFVSEAVSADSRPPLAEGPSPRKTAKTYSVQCNSPLLLHSSTVTGSRFEKRAAMLGALQQYVRTRGIRQRWGRHTQSSGGATRPQRGLIHRHTVLRPTDFAYESSNALRSVPITSTFRAFSIYSPSHHVRWPRFIVYETAFDPDII